MKIISTTLFGLLLAAITVSAQIPRKIAMEIIKAEDARRYDLVLEGLMKWPGIDLRMRAALAAGRIGDDKAIPALTEMLQSDTSMEARAMAAFAIGEIESAKGSEAIIKALDDPKTSNLVRARAAEAAGKIAAANPRDAKSKDLGDAVLDVLDAELEKGDKANRDTILLGITAVLRASPNESNVVASKFLTSKDARIRADAANTLTRLRAKNANAALRAMLKSDPDPDVRANAARALGAAEDKGAFDLLLDAATHDLDQRVRVSAIRSLVTLRDIKAVPMLIEHGKKLLAEGQGKSLVHPINKNELLEVATALGRFLAGTGDKSALEFLRQLSFEDKYSSSETEAAIARIAPDEYESWTKNKQMPWKNKPQAASAAAAGLTALASLDDSEKNKAIKLSTVSELRKFLIIEPGTESVLPATVQSDALRALAAFKPPDLAEIARLNLLREDVIVRSTAAGILANIPASRENIDALQKAFTKSLLTDKRYNDAQITILDVLFRLDKKGSVGTFLVALDAPDYLVRKKAFSLLADKDIQAASPGVLKSLENARAKHKDKVLPYSPSFGTKLGQILNTDVDYRRALSRKNGTVKAVFTTQKGTFTIDFYPEEAPLTVDNFVKLARTGYFNGIEVHRVVPNFVMQDGDPRGDGNGGPGWSIRCEVNMREYDRGAVGMALSGKDTGGSQWFVTHAPQPHLDGGYTVFGHVNETGMKVVDNIVRGDKIVKVVIVGR